MMELDWLKSIRGNRILRLADSSGLTAFKILNASNQVLWQAYSDGRMTSEGYSGNLENLDVIGKITVGSATPRIEIDGPNQRIQTSNFAAGSAGFRLAGDGSAEFNDVTVRGTIYAPLGQVGGFSIAATTLTGGNALLHSSGYLRLGTSNDIVRVDATDATYRLWAGHATAASAPFRVTKEGVLTATGATISGALTATSGAFTGLVRVGSSSPYIDIDGTNKRIRTSTFNAGYQGYSLEVDGSAEFNNVVVRGSIQGAVFEYGLIAAHAGTSIWTKSSGVLATDMIVPDSGTWYMVIVDPIGGGFLFENSDICRCKSIYSGGICDVWFTVASRTDLGDGTQRYTCTYQSGTKDVTYPAGGTVLDYGASGAGGVTISADASGAPYLNVFTHAGAPWTTLTERVRLGNMNGSFGTGANDRYGIGIGDYSGGNYLSYNAATAGAFILKAGGGDIVLSAAGMRLTEGLGGIISTAEINWGGYHKIGAYTGTYVNRFYIYSSRGTISMTNGYVPGTGAYFYNLGLLEINSGSTHNLWHLKGGGLKIGANDGLSSGATPAEGDVWLEGDSRVGGGAYFGSTATDPATGHVVATVACSGWLPFGQYTEQPPLSANGSPYACALERAGTVVSMAVIVYVSTTNNASNYWVIAFKRWDTNATLFSINTSALSANTTYRRTWTGTSAVTTSMLGIYVSCTKTGSPGTLYISCPAVYMR